MKIDGRTNPGMASITQTANSRMKGTKDSSPEALWDVRQAAQYTGMSVELGYPCGCGSPSPASVHRQQAPLRTSRVAGVGSLAARFVPVRYRGVREGRWHDMASVYRKNNRWYMRVRDENGAWRDKPSTARNKPEAERLAHEWESKARRQRLGEEPMPVQSGATVASLCEWWLANRCQAKSKSRGPVGLASTSSDSPWETPRSTPGRARSQGPLHRHGA